jgi:hypothetical protein
VTTLKAVVNAIEAIPFELREEPRRRLLQHFLKHDDVWVLKQGMPHQ